MRCIQPRLSVVRSQLVHREDRGQESCSPQGEVCCGPRSFLHFFSITRYVNTSVLWILNFAVIVSVGGSRGPSKVARLRRGQGVACTSPKRGIEIGRRQISTRTCHQPPSRFSSTAAGRIKPPPASEPLVEFCFTFNSRSFAEVAAPSMSPARAHPACIHLSSLLPWWYLCA